jgi:hypothetical protein
MSESVRVAKGPASTHVKSKMVTPFKGPGFNEFMLNPPESYPSRRRSKIYPSSFQQSKADGPPSFIAIAHES